MKKFLTLLLVFILVFSITLSFSSCWLFNKTPDDGPGDTNEDDNGGDNGGIESGDGDVYPGNPNGGDGIELPIIPIPSSPVDPDAGTEDGAENGGDVQ